ncbi:hypothetical protein DSO57_1020915 [Entomophthora muscae]|uniref:Uncharacterized protein n=1 Tax=Entomophthora muscae TaxID=34485 RepID=A0ACC2SGJ9_9FUNG|nr:hypothetical protein DSO57_1020915 [Entomophthora muscae]
MHPVVGLLHYISYNLILSWIITGRWCPDVGTLSPPLPNVNPVPENLGVDPPAFETKTLLWGIHAKVEERAKLFIYCLMVQNQAGKLCAHSEDYQERDTDNFPEGVKNKDHISKKDIQGSFCLNKTQEPKASPT